MDRANLKVVVVGGGLVGSLIATYFGQRGYNVHLYEYREDIRTSELVQGKSINLALSVRGLKALEGIGIADSVRAYGIPMYGRMIHSVTGKTRPIPYDPVYQQCIYSVGRKHINEVLLNEAEKMPNLHLNFDRKLVALDLEEKKLKFKSAQGKIEEVRADLIIGADGAFSAVRSELLKRSRINFSQTYIEHGYLELAIPPENNHKMQGNHLHIWPRDEFMMIALPNQDDSWTVTLFMPHTQFSMLDKKDKLLRFFRDKFPDAIDLIGEKSLIDTYFSTKPSFLISIKVSKYNYKDHVVLVGDAAHAMVPFYGQGMNAGFEDCRLLDDFLHNRGLTIREGLEEYSKSRNPNAEAICDLAMYNYIEMRHLVNTTSFIVRKFFDNCLYRIVPSLWIPLYQSVTFSNMDYLNCIKNKKWQDMSLEKFLYAFGVTSAALAFITMFKITTK
ncbi:kynurenine 3-monooxygenase [Cimex lectularius]|uniref:Kynurenine 3-monooxygenase n=1 Tax=Cimex lectularius TaxID=79782 RepID=A0A8I6S0B8_CIMLE|nr:kynurenine 3-monooxygenase [Cimex lectularius]